MIGELINNFEVTIKCYQGTIGPNTIALLSVIHDKITKLDSFDNNLRMILLHYVILTNHNMDTSRSNHKHFPMLEKALFFSVHKITFLSYYIKYYYYNILRITLILIKQFKIICLLTKLNNKYLFFIKKNKIIFLLTLDALVACNMCQRCIIFFNI